MKRFLIAGGAVGAFAGAICAVALVTSGTALGTETQVGAIPGDVIVYGPSVTGGSTGSSGPTSPTSTSGTSGTSGNSGNTGATGTTGTNTSPVPQCPGSPCVAVTKTTGFQVKVGTVHSPATIPVDGSIVAWTLTLGAPTTTGTSSQTAFFNSAEGGPAEAGIAILKAGPKLEFTLVAQSPVVQLQPYFGDTVEFPLATSIPVKKGEILGLTVPTWAPVLALTDATGRNYGKYVSWRASRSRTSCKTTSAQTAQQGIASTLQYGCLYQGVRLTYSAVLISTP